MGFQEDVEGVTLLLDLPGNFEAAFALAAFHLRIMLGNKDDKNEVKKTKTGQTR